LRTTSVDKDAMTALKFNVTMLPVIEPEKHPTGILDSTEIELPVKPEYDEPLRVITSFPFEGIET
jgi:hypothetical protein